METQSWIVSQIAIDVVMFALLLVVLWFHLRGRLPGGAFDAGMERSKRLLEEMTKIGSTLENNLLEKRALTSSIFSELDMRIEKAEKASRSLEEILYRYQQNLGREPVQRKQPAPNRQAIHALLSTGLSREDVARNLNVPVAELELMLKLQSVGNKADD